MSTAEGAPDPKLEQHTEETEDDSEHDTGTESTENEHHAADGATKKKKKKKKKKKTGAAAAADGSSEQAGSTASSSSSDKLTPAEKQEAERRFHKALDSAKQGEDMWVLLAAANIHDAKLKKLSDSLRDNSSVTSVNLSSNHIGDEGVQALVDVLQQGGCSELISLDLRGNTLSPEAEALLADLGKKRKQLDIATGPVPPPPEPEASSSSSSGSGHGSHRGGRGGRGARGGAGGRGAAGQQQAQQHQQQQQGKSERSIEELVRTSPMFRRYFQTGDEEDAEGSSGEEEGEQAEQLPPPAEVWAKVEELLPKGVDSIPELSAALVTISKALDSEMAAMPAHEEEANMDDFQPHFKAVVQHLPQLQQVMQLQPPPKVHQSSSSTPQPTVGSHRVWACGILHMLLLHNNIIIDRAVAEAKLLPTVMAMAFQHGHCSAIQCRAVEMLRSSLRSSVQELWLGLFQPGYGQQLQQPGSKELLPPLHEGLVQIAESVRQQPMGKRPCSTGFAIEVANTLLQSSDAANPEQLCSALVPLLESSAAWQSSIAAEGFQDEGCISSLLKEQDGHLCEPPPVRPAPSIDSMDEDSMDPLGGLMMNGQLVALLNHMREQS